MPNENRQRETVTLAFKRGLSLALSIGRRGLLRVVYLFSPRAYWNFRSRELHHQWYDHDLDFRIYHEIIESLQVKSCLEIGCNGGRYSKLLVNHVEKLSCQDISPRAIAICRENIPADKLCRVTMQCGRIETLYAGTPKRSIDLVICNRVLSALKPKDIGRVVGVLSRISRHVVINELMIGDPGAAYYWFAHDYDRLFCECAMRCTREIVSNNQRFRLYAHDS